ncbi:MAG: dephospho-CoA kinase [Anaerolineae bacterium]|jgi:dephospho-CoA kinase
MTAQRLIGLTGNIATGKSTVAAMLAELGATVIDADKIAHQVMRRGSAVYERIVEAFGLGVVGADGEIDRQHLGRTVFEDTQALRRLEEIVHPAVGVEIQRRIAAARTPLIVLEAIKLIEAGLHHLCQALWVTTCPSEQQIDRLMRDRALSFEGAALRVGAQPPQAQKISLADVVIDTSDDMAETRRQVEAALNH